MGDDACHLGSAGRDDTDDSTAHVLAQESGSSGIAAKAEGPGKSGANSSRPIGLVLRLAAQILSNQLCQMTMLRYLYRVEKSRNGAKLNPNSSFGSAYSRSVKAGRRSTKILREIYRGEGK